MKNAILRGLVVFSLGFGMMALSACAEQTDTPTEEPAVEETPMEEEVPMEPDTTMATDDTTMAAEEPMEEGEVPVE